MEIIFWLIVGYIFFFTPVGMVILMSLAVILMGKPVDKSKEIK
ncbi:MAG: hypothetical protein Q7R85_04370 [bacterium]|nr:hypothetical protein [bacterium]